MKYWENGNRGEYQHIKIIGNFESEFTEMPTVSFYDDTHICILISLYAMEGNVGDTCAF